MSVNIQSNQVLPDKSIENNQNLQFEGGADGISQYMTKEMIEQSKELSKTTNNPIKLSWENLNFKVQIEKQIEEGKNGKKEVIEQQIIKNVSGYAMPGQTMYIMGASGAGKTSLLNILSDRIGDKTGQEITGERVINDKMKIDDSNFGLVSGYVMQDDILYSHFTPREALHFAANLKLAHLKQEERDKKVAELVIELGLSGCADTLIGNVLQKFISGGERKRTAIGVELITNPSLLLLDEPTSGLDSFKALQIVKLLKKLAKQGKTIISTIHQPSSESFLEFDRLLLMSDGFCVYQGDAKKSAQYFRDLKFKLPTFSNPADTYMRILAVNYPKTEKDFKKLAFFNKFYDRRIKQSVKTENQLLELPVPNLQGLEKTQAGTWQEFKYILGRNKLGVMRDPMQSKAKLGQQAIFSLIMAAIFYKIGFHNENGLEGKVDGDYSIRANFDKRQNQQLFYSGMEVFGSFFFAAVNFFMGNMFNAILVFQAERPVFLREQANKMYGVFPYFMAKTLMDTPMLLLTPVLALLITYFANTYERTGIQILYFYIIVSLQTQAAASLGYFLSSIFENEQMAQGVAPLAVFPMLLFGGLFANNESLAWLSWIQYISPIKYTAEALMWNEFRNDPHELRDDLMEFIGYKLSFGKCCGIMVCLIVGFRIIAFLMFRIMVSKVQ